MSSEILYLLQANLAMTVLYGFYVMLLRNDTFFAWRRAFLVFAPFVSALVPVCRLDALFPAHKPFIATITPQTVDIVVSGAGGFSLSDAGVVAMFAGAGVMLLRLLVRLCSLLYLGTHARRHILSGRKVMLIDRETGPFSFFGWIFINKNLHDSGNIEEIILHENIHARQMHSLDILLYEIVAALCWYNPLVVQLKREVKRNLEFIADRAVLKTGCDKQNYQYSLLKASMMQYEYSHITNNFNFNHLKKRIVMMNKKQSKRINLFKYALLAPVFSGMALLASAQEPTGTSAEKDPKAQASDIATIVFDKDTHDFGTIGESEGEVSAVFTFENRGNEPLLIREVKASCGCTIPEWTKEPVQPGGKGYVKATYGAKGRVYPFEKQITVYGNGKPANVVLRIKGTVVK